jgi:hypothetical protein
VGSLAVLLLCASASAHDTPFNAESITRAFVGSKIKKHGPNLSVYVSLKYDSRAPTQVLTDCDGAFQPFKDYALGTPPSTWQPDHAVIRIGIGSVRFASCSALVDVATGRIVGYQPDIGTRAQPLDAPIPLNAWSVRRYYHFSKAHALRKTCHLLKVAQNQGVASGRRIHFTCHRMRAVDANAGRTVLYMRCSRSGYGVKEVDEVHDEYGVLFIVKPCPRSNHGKWHNRRLLRVV